MTLFDYIDATTPEYGTSNHKLRKEIKRMRGCIQQLVRARVDVDAVLGEVKDEYIRTAVLIAKGNRSKAALMTGLHRNTISRHVPGKRKPVASAGIALTMAALRKTSE